MSAAPVSVSSTPGRVRRRFRVSGFGRACAAVALLILVAGVVAGCGYTVLQQAGRADQGTPGESAAAQREAAGDREQGAGEADSLAWLEEEPDSSSWSREEPDSASWAERSDELEDRLPPGHPPVMRSEDWIGRSFLDRILGEDDPLRFENLRQQAAAHVPSHNATITVRITAGGPAVADVWQVRMDEFGWVTAAHWTQGAAGPTLDETTATERAEFRLARESEAALRAMVIELLPETSNATLPDLPQRLRKMPVDWWPFADAGLIEIEYHIETLGLVDQDDWPGGRVSGRLDLIQLLIGTWDSPPPLDLRREVLRLVDRHPSLVNLAMMAEAVALAWEVEGYDDGAVELPIWVGR
jgi:hypothetical protein